MPWNYYIEDDEESAEESEEEIDSEDKTSKYNFAELEESIKSVIEDYNEKVFVKLNWSAPRDANWIVPNLNCDSSTEVYSLLKSSTFITHDISAAYEGWVDKGEKTCPDKLYLILKKYHHNVRAHRESEFRCFVKDNILIAITQRDTQVFYEHLVELMEAYKPIIIDFFESEIKNKFIDPDFIFDLYIDIAPNNKVWLIDFNPWHSKTDPCLFEWSEVIKIIDENEETPVWKIIEEEQGIKANEMTQYKVPTDIVEYHNSDEVKEFFENMRDGKMN